MRQNRITKMDIGNNKNDHDCMTLTKGRSVKQEKKVFTIVSTFFLLIITVLISTLMLNGCGSSGGGPSSAVVSGTAAVGIPLVGQVSLKDASNPAQMRTTTIGPDGSYSIDVTNMMAPFILQANGHADDTTYRLHTFAAGPGIANVNPFSDLIVAGACDDDPEAIFANPNAENLDEIGERIDGLTADLLDQLDPLMNRFNARGQNPIKDHFVANHQGMDGILDTINITIVDGYVTITDKVSGAIIFTADVANFKGGHFNNNSNGPSQTVTVPTPPANLTALGGSGQVTLSWDAVDGAAMYHLYYATVAGVTPVNGTKIPAVSSPYVQTGLNANSTYYYVVTAANSAGESTVSAEDSATTDAFQPPVTIPAQPSALFATGGTNQVTISWNSVPNATAYNLYYATSSGVSKENGILVANTASPVVMGDLPDASTYYFIVTAINSAGEGTASTEATATTNAAAPPVCGSCHAIPPANGRHSRHLSKKIGCEQCHGAGYSSSTVNAETHMNGVKNVTLNVWDSATRKCATFCHGSKAW